MVKIIDNPTSSFAERVSRGLHAAVKPAAEGLVEYGKRKEKKTKELDKRKSGLQKSIDPYLKKFHESYLSDEKKYNSLSDRAKKYVDAGYSDDDAIRGALADMRNEKPATGGTTEGGTGKLGHGTADKGKIVGGGLEGFIEGFKESPGLKKYEGDQSVFQRFGEFNKALGTSVAEHGKDIAAHPGKELAAAGSQIANVLVGWPSDVLEAGLKRGGFISPDADPNLVRQELDKIQGWIQEGRSPEEIERLAKRQAAYGFAPIAPIIKGAKWLGGLFKGNKAAPALQEVAREVEAAVQASEAIPGMQKSVSKQPPKGPTISRIERAAPESKLFKTGEQAVIREKQLKMHPQYAEEIAADTAERAARAEAKVPKTAVGEAGVAKRMAVAEAQVPKAQEMYQKTVARVRGLESELARGTVPEQKAAMESLYNAAVKELNEAEFHLKTVLNNAKTGEARVGAEQMRQAARNKILRIEDEILDGKEPKLSLKDYNPEFIKKAKDISKKKPLPATRHEDYFTQVHEGYANEYRGRIADLDRELEKLKKVPGMAPLQRGLQINREKETMKKLVDHIDAENAIHRHKMALRETQQRQVARERLGKFTKQAGQAKVKELAKEALKSPEKAAEATEVAFEEAMANAKTKGERELLAKEKDVVKARLEQEAVKMKEGTGLGKSIEEASTGATTAKEAAAKSSRFTIDLKEVMESLKSGGKNFFQTRIGKDLLWGVGSEIVTQVSKGEDLPITPSTLTAIAGGRRGGVYRYAFAQMTRWIWKKGQKSEYKKALKEGDDEKLIQLRSKMSPKLRKEATEEYREELSA